MLEMPWLQSIWFTAKEGICHSSGGFESKLQNKINTFIIVML